MAGSRRAHSARQSHVLVVGGARDPNIAALLRTLERERIEHRALLVGSEAAPRLAWDLESGALRIDGEPVVPTAAFIRHDVFESMAGRGANAAYRAHAWSGSLMAWLLCHPKVRLLNRSSLQESISKPHVLHLARQVGLRVPRTLVTNDLSALAEFESGRPRIAKPVIGGDYCRDLSEVLGRAGRRGDAMAAPAIVQTRLIQPEVRIYAVAGRVVCFRVISDDLDYRERQSARLELDFSVPRPVLEGLARLLARMKLDFAAADFKTCPDTGDLLLLEVNNSPMFAAFDAVAEGALTLAMADFLAGHNGS